MTTQFNQSETVVYLRMPNWIGDISMCLPMLHGLMDQGVRIVMCAKPWAKDLLSAYRFDGWIEITGNIREDASRVRTHKKQHQHDKAVGLIVPDSISSALVFRLAGVPSAGYKDEGRTILLKWPIKKPVVPMHAVEFWYNLAFQACKNWGLALAPAPEKKLNLQLREEAYELCAKVMQDVGLREYEYVLIAPTAKGLHKGKNKVWAEYAELYNALTRIGAKVVMCPPAHEVKIARAAAPDTPMVPPLPLDAFAVLCKKAALVICNDSGVSHLSAAVEARQLSLFGVSTLLRTRPWSSRAYTLGDEGNWPSLDDVINRSIELVETTKAVA
ncbi:glycosyltransferase family 9 protein [Paenalcaligenes niemegkensis]|uniref:glycosyltransferase family 9 protein n=1 Tax=Paenalcaligenes niemegkensis TaxID=2895469 RepID=UPI001EE8D5AD|nr:glycosyltransferase family 9 protein [Paenalcaligenes niemegkensis]MCQ9615615.1 glycosyltransferase family 9 protein [Paenalcaligenes niemegkensis]